MKIRTIELYGDDRIIDRVVERTYARHPASSTKRGASSKKSSERRQKKELKIMNLPSTIDREKFEKELNAIRTRESRKHAERMSEEQARFEGFEHGVQEALGLLIGDQCAAEDAEKPIYPPSVLSAIDWAKECVNYEQ